jgi:hypothetical protein
MPTYYRPTEHRRKRVVYKSTDPDEPKRDGRKMLIFFGVLTFIILVAAAIAVWVK